MDVLGQFGLDHGITYRMLGDVGSVNLDRLGLVDRDIEAHQAEFGVPTGERHRGVAYPAVFLLDEQGVVRQKRIQRNYRLRETGATLLEAALGRGVLGADPVGLESPSVAGPVQVGLRLDHPYYRPFQINRAHVDVQIAPGFHVYSEPVPPGFHAFSVEVEPPEWAVGTPELPPATRTLQLEGLQETFVCHEAGFTAVVPFAVLQRAGSGAMTVAFTIRYQACDDRECFPPVAQRIAFDLEEQGLD